MNNFEYTIKDENGIHARPAGLIAKKAKELGGNIILECKGKTVDPSKLLSLMSMGIGQGDTVKLSAPQGTDLTPLWKLFQENL